MFENRYKGLLVNDDRYLLSLLRYVHQNPVCAKICYKVNNYPWSSDHYYRENKTRDLVVVDLILDIFSEDRKNALKAYCDFMDENKLEAKITFEGVDIVGKKEYVHEQIISAPNSANNCFACCFISLSIRISISPHNYDILKISKASVIQPIDF